MRNKISWKYNKYDLIKDNKRDLTIIDKKIIPRYKKDGTLKCYDKYYKYHCNSCGYNGGKHYRKGEYKEELWVVESALFTSKQGCSCCHNLITVEGINDISTTAPWMIKYFQGGYDEAKKYTKSSSLSIQPICPDCGNISSKSTRIADIYRNNSISCNFCSDGISYPNKFMFNLLEQLHIDFEAEYSPKWIGLKRYDFYIPSLNIIIEMDGALGHGNKKHGKNKISPKESKDADKYKDIQAKLHNIEVIRIKCDYNTIKTRHEYIKQNILQSKLQYLVDLSKINWIVIEKRSLSNKIKEACLYKRNKNNITAEEISKIMHLHKSTIIKYLHKGTKLGWCCYNPKEEIVKGNIKRTSILIICINTGILSNSSRECAYIHNNIINTSIKPTSITRVCKGERLSYKGFQFKYIKDLTPEEYIKYDIENKLKELHNQELVQAC